jgi:hypothetical protein
MFKKLILKLFAVKMKLAKIKIIFKNNAAKHFSGI